MKYVSSGLPILFEGDSSLETVDIDLLNSRMESSKVDYLLEKSALKKKLKTKKSDKIVITGGQDIQTRVLPDSTKANQDYPKLTVIGVYDNKGTANQRIKSLSKPTKIVVDTDTAGNYIAYMQNLYAYQDPLKNNVIFPVRSLDTVGVDEEKALKFHAVSIFNSFATKRNKALKDVLKAKLDGKPLKYRLSTGEFKDLVMSLQQLEIVKLVYTKQSSLIVETSDNITVSFDWEFKDISDELKPRLIFKPSSLEPQHLDSDTLLLHIVEKFGFEADSVQAILESLNNRNWITYPRVGLDAAIDTPIKIQDDKKYEEFMGTGHEKSILKIIRDAELAFNDGKPYLMRGEWILTDGDKLNLITSGDKLAEYDLEGNLTLEYTDTEFDIKIDDDGKKTTGDLTKSLIFNEIGTKATRTQLLSQLKQSGVISLVNNKYQVDIRGLYMVATYQYLTDSKYGINAKPVQVYQKEINNLKYSSGRDAFIKELYRILNEFKIVNRPQAIEKISEISKDIVESEKDLARLQLY